MPSIVLVAPGPLDARTGGYIYDRRIVDGLRQKGWPVEVLPLDSSFPHPTPGALDHAGRALAQLPAGTVMLVDSLALGAMPELVMREASRLRVVALVHQPLSAAVGLHADTAARFAHGERRALGAAEMIVVTGRAALPFLVEYGVDPNRIRIVEPGTDPAPLAHGFRGEPRSVSASGDPGRPIELLTVATLNPGKGYDVLLAALSTVTRSPWRLTCAGSLTRDPETARRVQTAAAELGLEPQVSFVGDLDGPSLSVRYDAADVFVLASRQETYGMAVAEALARGLPVVATMTGAIPDLVGSDAGVLVPVGDAPALAGALARVVGDAGLRARLAEGARRRRAQLPTWDDASERMAAALGPLCAVNSRG